MSEAVTEGHLFEDKGLLAVVTHYDNPSLSLYIGCEAEEETEEGKYVKLYLNIKDLEVLVGSLGFDIVSKPIH